MDHAGLNSPFTTSLNRAARKRAIDAIELLGKALPCSVIAVSGQIVTVAFQVNAGIQTLPPVTAPIATSKYDWLPIQVGDLGVVMPADAYLGGVSGLGGGIASLTQPANLEALIFVPISHLSWVSAGTPNQRVVQGPAGVLIQDIAGTASINISAGQISMHAGGHSIVIDSSGVVIDGKIFLTHEHTGVTTGLGDTGPVV